MRSRELLNNKAFIAGFLSVCLLVLISLAAPLLSPYQPNAIDVDSILSKPDSEHFLGTDSLGRDLLTRLLYGGRVSLKVGFIAVGIALLIGVTLGSMAGFYGGWVDYVLMRFVDLMLCFPTFFLILSVVALLEPSIGNIMLIIGATSWMGVCRIVRAQVLSLKEREFVQASKIMGAGNFYLITRHILPLAAGPVIVAGILGMANAILVESALSFLGIGVQPPTPSWGNILIEAKSTLGIAWWLTLFPGLSIFVTILSYNLLGEGLKRSFRE